MPRDTFHKLKEEKRELITNAFLREFAIKTYDEASITQVVKELGIAKGSMYQYFDDKLDLFMYLIEECSKVKMQYTLHVSREDYPDYWEYFHALFLEGLKFDANHPLQSHFLHNLTQNLNSPSVKEQFDQLQKQVVEAFTAMVKYEVGIGKFRDDVDLDVLGFMLYKLGTGVQEHLEYHNIINPQQSIETRTPVYQGKKKELIATLNHYIALARSAFDKQ